VAGAGRIAGVEGDDMIALILAALRFLAPPVLIGLAIVLAAAAWLQAMPVKAGECVVASHYGAESGNRTADGSYFNGTQMFAAHRTMKFGTKLRVTYQGRSVVVTVRDRGPYIRGRQLDLSTAAAKKLGMVKAGVARVCLTRL